MTGGGIITKIKEPEFYTDRQTILIRDKQESCHGINSQYQYFIIKRPT